MRKNRTILLVDDDEDDKELFFEAVKDIDDSIQCLNSGNGEEALKLLDGLTTKLPDLIFLDLNMPRMNGLQFLSAIKKDKGLKNIPVIIYSTSKQDKDLRLTAQMGANDFICKPSSFRKIGEAIKEVMEREWNVKYEEVKKK